MKKIVFFFFSFGLFLSGLAIPIPTPEAESNTSTNYQINLRSAPARSPFDSTLHQLEIYDPSVKNYFYGLGFPGAACRSISFLLPDSIGIFPVFSSYQTLFLSPKFQIPKSHKPLTQVQYVIFPSLKTEQYLDLVHFRNINERNSLGFQIRKLKSNGYFLQQGSNITNLNLVFNAKSKNLRYEIRSELFYNGVVSIENGGLENDSIDYSSRSIALQSLPINLEDAKNRQKFFGGKIVQSYFLGKVDSIQIDSLNKVYQFQPSSSINLGVNYSRFYSAYIDNNPLDGFYSLVYLDSADTFDKSLFDQFYLDLNFSNQVIKSNGKSRLLLSKVGIRNELSFLERIDATRQYENTSIYCDLNSNPSNANRFALQGNYYLRGYNAENLDVSLLLGRKFLDSSAHTFATDLIFQYKLTNPAFIYQNYKSNHFSWSNKFVPISSKSLTIRVSSPSTVNALLGITSLSNYVFLDSNSLPKQLNSDLEIVSGTFEKLFHLNKFYLNARINYQKVLKGTDVLGLPDFFTRSSIYWSDQIFKRALFLQIGFDFTYTSSYKGLAYQPALNTFYYQTSKTNGKYPAIDLFINFKIRQARMFFKVDHLNYGLSNGSYSYVPGYLLPGRTFRFGISWLFVN